GGGGLGRGRGVGWGYVGDSIDQWRQGVTPRGVGVAEERRRLAGAMTRAREELAALSQHISELVGEDHGAILHAQLMIMQDRTIERDLAARLDRGASAEGALIATLDQYVEAFRKVATPFFQERVYDVKDVFHRLLWQLRPRPEAEGDRVVLVAREASVMELFAVDLDRLAGVVVEHGGPQSHAAILARSLGVPMVGQVSDFAALRTPGRRLLVDGSTGLVWPDPPESAEDRGQRTEDREQKPGGRGQGRVFAPLSSVLCPLSSDLWPEGLPRLEANINLLSEVAPAVAQRAGGVGLYRSEFLFLARRTVPTEEEQVGIYRKLLHLLRGRPASIRTFDLRADKLPAGSHLLAAGPHSYDWRRVRESPSLQQLFKDQVRAILRAGAEGPVRILVPLVVYSEQLDFVLVTVAQARQELRREGLAHGRDVPLGI